MDNYSDFGNFSSMLSFYRVTEVLIAVWKLGIADALSKKSDTVEGLIEKCYLSEKEGRRFIHYLVSVGLLNESSNGQIFLSKFLDMFFRSDSADNQFSALQFERSMMQKWSELSYVVRHGQGSNLRTDKSNDEYLRDLKIYQDAMCDAAKIRASELWAAFTTGKNKGLILDLGSGKCIYLNTFMQKHPEWNGVACDIADVLDACNSEKVLKFPINLLDELELKLFSTKFSGSADIILMSNFLHCYDNSDVEQIVTSVADVLKFGGSVIVHDFFIGSNDFSTLYDIHMLVNTFSGKVYTANEVDEIFIRSGFVREKIVKLPSFSDAIVYRRGK